MLEESVARAQQEMEAFYRPRLVAAKELQPQIRQINDRICALVEDYAAQNPHAASWTLKARQAQIIAEHFRPALFPHSPFFFEMGVRHPCNWGNPGDPANQPGSKVHHLKTAELTKQHIIWDTPVWHSLSAMQDLKRQPEDNMRQLYWLTWGSNGFDSDHHCIGYTRLLREGFAGILQELAARRATGGTTEQLSFLDAATDEIRALLRVAERFADEAQAQLAHTSDPEERANLAAIAEAARHIPLNPPRTFYEGLAMLYFVREATASLESIGISVLGHPDRQLIGLYRADLATGRLTAAEAERLVALWMLPTDIKHVVRESQWPETSTCMELGGCDENGDIVWNELTRLFINTHRRYKLVNPKPNCRISAESPQEYLELLAECNLAGHNHFALLNDDVLIPANMRYGKTEAEARLYVNGGCQETMCEGVEHTAGAYFYFNLVATFQSFFAGVPVRAQQWPARSAEALPPRLQAAADFEDFYRQTFAALCHSIGVGAAWLREQGRNWWKVNPCPLFSATLKGCIDNARDYTAGGAKHNLSGVTLVGFGDVINSLLAVRELVFAPNRTARLSLSEYQRIVRDNWAGEEALRKQVLACPRFGHGDADADALAARLAKDLAAFCRTQENERGSFFQPSFFVYWMFATLGEQTLATPDGRRSGDLLSQGISPHRFAAPQSLSDTFRTLSRIDLRDFPGNAVLDVQLPTGGAISTQKLAATIRAFARMGGATLQLNCVNAEELRQAQREPEKHGGLTVRISGLSAYFVSLTPRVQNEIIERAEIAV